MKKFYIETHGCQMNVHDTEKAAFALTSEGYAQTTDAKEADLVLLNTCMVREKPEQKVFKRIEHLKYAQLRESGKSATFGVMGCVAQAVAERVFDRSRDVKLVIGTQAISKLPALLGQIEQGFQKAIDVALTKDAEFFEVSAAARRSSQVAYISIIEGCNKFCSYCIVPYTRGRERSRSAESILSEAQALRDNGYKEIQLLGQNVNSYGLSGKLRGNISKTAREYDSNEITFAALLELLARESGIPRIKYTTSYPRDFDLELVNIMDRYDNLCEWVHLPAQSGSDRILRMMRRGYTLKDYMQKIEFIKGAKKDYSITGDIIVGFPGETAEDFDATMKMVAEVEYDGLYIFEYSARPNTAASALEETVSPELKTERLMKLLELQNRVQKMRYGRYLQKEVEVLVEGISARNEYEYMGHTRCSKTVNFPSNNSSIGDIVKVKIDKIGKNSMHGELVN